LQFKRKGLHTQSEVRPLLAEFLQKLNAGKAVSAASMMLSEIVETIYIPYTQEKRASTRKG